MKYVLGIVLSLFATAAFAFDGGNSSGGDESPNAGTIPFEVPKSTLIGVVDSVTPGTATWKVTFNKTFLAHGTTAEFKAPTNQMSTPIVGSLFFLRGTTEPYSIGRVVPSTADREKALAEYLFEADPKSRLEWADRYAKSTDLYLLSCVLAELEIQTKGKLKDTALSILGNNPNLKQLQMHLHVATKLLPHPDALAIVKPYALDTKEMTHIRWSAMYAIVWRKDRAFRDLVEAWKDGREGADKWLQDEALKAWNKIYQGNPAPQR